MRRSILFLIVAAGLLVYSVRTGWAELDPNIFWVSDSTVGPLQNIVVQNGNIIRHDGGTVKEIDDRKNVLNDTTPAIAYERMLKICCYLLFNENISSRKSTFFCSSHLSV